MISRYKTVSIDAATPGMVLRQHLPDGRGGVLMAKGTALTDTTLTGLRRRGVACVDVVDVLDDSLSEAAWTAECERLRSRLAHLFRNSAGNRAGMALRQQIWSYRTGGVEGTP